MEEYYKDSNPMNWVDGIVRPVLVINSEDAGLACPGVRADTRAVVSLAGTCVAITVTSTQKVRI